VIRASDPSGESTRPRALLDDDAVSPVIGVILLVAITVILAAVIGTFVLGLNDRVTGETPQAQFTTTFDEGAAAGGDCPVSGGDGDLTITLEAGDSVEADDLYLSEGGTGAAWSGDCGGDQNGNSEVVAGAQVTVQADADTTVRVVRESDDGESGQTLARWEGADARYRSLRSFPHPHRVAASPGAETRRLERHGGNEFQHPS